MADRAAVAAMVVWAALAAACGTANPVGPAAAAEAPDGGLEPDTAPAAEPDTLRGASTDAESGADAGAETGADAGADTGAGTDTGADTSTDTSPAPDASPVFDGSPAPDVASLPDGAGDGLSDGAGDGGPAANPNDATGTDGTAGAADGGGPADGAAADGGAVAAKPFHVTGYYASWMASHLPVGDIDFGALTTVVHFSIFPKADGTFDTTSNGITASQTQALVSAAHSKKVQVLLGVGGSWTQEGFRVWTKPAKRADFVQLLIKKLKNGGYDGIDLDMEPVDDSDAKDFVPFVQDLRAAMDASGSGLLLTAAVGWNKAVYGPIHKLFDRINIMTYDLSGPWPGWETWHNSPLSNGGKTFASTGAPMPSCQTLWADAIAAGAPKAKLGIGMVFYAYVWSGADGPNQPIGGVQVKANMPYFEMMDTLFTPAAAKWHKGPQAPYLSTGSGKPAKFVSYDNEQSIAAKIAWAKQQGLAGVIIWELGGGWRPSQPKGQRDLLLQAVKQAAFP